MDSESMASATREWEIRQPDTHPKATIDKAEFFDMLLTIAHSVTMNTEGELTAQWLQRLFQRIFVRYTVKYEFQTPARFESSPLFMLR